MPDNIAEAVVEITVRRNPNTPVPDRPIYSVDVDEFWLQTVPVLDMNATDGDNVSTDIQSALVISNSKGLTETLREIRTSTYQS